MWKQFLDLFRQLLLLSENAKRTQDEIADVQRKVTDLSHFTGQNFQRVDSLIERLAYEIKRLNDELQRSREREADARERLRLELENKMLREKRQLPPAANGNDKDNGSER